MTSAASNVPQQSLRTWAASSAAAVAAVTAALVLAVLAALHLLSPEFNPSWRMVSEYANGRYGLLLSFMFGLWAVSSWSLASALRPYLQTRASKIGLAFLVVAGIGEGMAAFFDVNQPLHGVAGALGVGGFPIAAVFITRTLRRLQLWSGVRKPLAFTAHLSWVLAICTIGSILLLFVTYTHAGGQVPADGKPLPLDTVLPSGAIAVNGYVNRLLIVVFCAWATIAVWPVLRQGASTPGRL